MIVDSSVVMHWLTRGGEFENECRKIRESLEKGNIIVRIPDVVIYDVYVRIAESEIPTDFASRLIHLASQYLNFLAVRMSGENLAEAIRVCRKVGVDFATASCAVLSKDLEDLYVTADRRVCSILSEHGFRVTHVSDIF